MSEKSRPSPDALLSAIKQEEMEQKRGKLTIFLGMSAGAGKTYAMLKVAHHRKADGIDVAIAVVESHGRAETEALCAGLSVIPLRPIEYHGITLREMDMDAVLLRKPQIVLVDELAHTNAPGSRHPKRYQDVLELLDAGIDVYTTLNVQHVESRVDVVRQITGVSIHETVPDSVLDRADKIQLVDLSPDELRERLAEGKVYLGEMAETAAAHFFREENLTALREITLRVTAEHVGQDLRDAMAVRQIEGPWKTNAKLMVAVGPSPFSEELIRWTRRTASALGAPWIAVYVEPAVSLNEGEKQRLVKTLSMARQLGAHVITTAGHDLVSALLRVGQEEQVTQIVVGKPPGHPVLEFLKGGSPVERLIRRSGDIDICVVRAEQREEGPRPSAWKTVKFKPWAMEIGIGALSVAAVTGACWLLRGITGYWAIALIYLTMVVFLGTQLRRATILLIATASALLWNFLFIPPLFTFRIGNFPDALMFIMYFIVALVIGQLTARLRLKEMVERKREQRTAALYRLAQGVVESTSLDEGLRRTMQEIQKALHAECAILLVEESGQLSDRPHPASNWQMSDKEKSLAVWALMHGHLAGRFTDTLPEADALHIPLQTTKNKVGVLSVHFGLRRTLALDERELLETFADQIAVMIERYWLIQQTGQARLMEESEKLYRTIFDCISHEIKTPLAVIQAATSELGSLCDHLREVGKGRNFIKEIDTASQRLSGIVDNLLSMTRIESGRYRLEPAWCDVDEIISSARQQIGDALAQHKVSVIIPEEMPSIKVDPGFLEQSLVNLLSNAALYSPEGSEIRVAAHMDDGHLVLRVIDEGLGLSPEMASRVFEKFYRGPNAPPGGVGLGLSIVRGLIQALGGEVTTENNPERGATFTLRIPVEARIISANT
ncbi:MAG: sensor histidine kinase KdpD [Candidatus Aureabacteria bacterium]|nr:sensor histidine kinase KdpD [Candidatus Auribacterota bacterium]